VAHQVGGGTPHRGPLSEGKRTTFAHAEFLRILTLSGACREHVIGMAASVSTDDGGRSVAGEYLVAEPRDYFHFAEAPDWVYGLMLQPDPETRPAASVREIGTSIET